MSKTTQSKNFRNIAKTQIEDNFAGGDSKKLACDLEKLHASINAKKAVMTGEGVVHTATGNKGLFFPFSEQQVIAALPGTLEDICKRLGAKDVEQYSKRLERGLSTLVMANKVGRTEADNEPDCYWDMTSKTKTNVLNLSKINRNAPKGAKESTMNTTKTTTTNTTTTKPTLKPRSQGLRGKIASVAGAFRLPISLRDLARVRLILNGEEHPTTFAYHHTPNAYRVEPFGAGVMVYVAQNEKGQWGAALCERAGGYQGGPLDYKVIGKTTHIAATPREAFVKAVPDLEHALREAA